MCGRYGLKTDPRQFVEKQLRGRAPADYAFVAHTNIAPTQDVLVVPNTPERELTTMRWSLVPRFDPAKASRLSTFNARAESLGTSNIYAPLLGARRAIVPADGYYEWRKNADGSKTPLWIYRRDGAPVLFAALWDRRRGPDDTRTYSMTIVTKPPVEELEGVHDRMPAVLPPELAERWLSSEPMDSREAIDLLLPSEIEAFAFYPVSKRVGNVANEGLDLCEPLTPQEAQAQAAPPVKARKKTKDTEQPRLF